MPILDLVFLTLGFSIKVLSPNSSIDPILVPGLPTIIEFGGTSLQTTAPAPIRECCEIVLPQTMVLLAPSVTPSSRIVSIYLPFLE